MAWIVVAAAIGYIAVSRWVSYSFVPARLLWLLPFLCLAAAQGIGRRRWLAAVILLSHGTSIALYFWRENFLNPGYVAPIREVAATLNAEAAPEDVILLDPYNTDYQAISAQLSARTPVVVLEGLRATPRASAVWIVRNTRDASPGGATSAAEAAACNGRERIDTLLLPYAPWQRAVLRAVGSPLTHYYRLTVCRRAARVNGGWPEGRGRVDWVARDFPAAGRRAGAGRSARCAGSRRGPGLRGGAGYGRRSRGPR